MGYFQDNKISKKLKKETQSQCSISKIKSIYKKVIKLSRRQPPPFDWQDKMSYNGKEYVGQNSYEITSKILKNNKCKSI